MKRLFIYGTLKRGFPNHSYLARQTFCGAARTRPGYRLYKVADYPGMIADPASADVVDGEVWEVDDHCLASLDYFEGVPEGLYERDSIDLRPPFDEVPVEAYFFLHSVSDCPVLGSCWEA